MSTETTQIDDGRKERPSPAVDAQSSPPPERKRARWLQIQDFKGASLSFPFLAGFTLFSLVPIAMALRESLYKSQSSGLGFGEDVVTFVGLENLIDAFVDTRFWDAMIRVFLYAVVIVPVTQLVSLGMALVLDAASRRIAARFRIALLLPYMVPGIVATMIWIYLYSPAVGPLRNFFSLFGVDANFYSSDLIWVSIGNLALWGAIGFNMLILYGGLQSVPHEVFEAARLDGANEFRIALSIKVPFVRGPLVLTTLLSIIGTLQIFNEPLLFRAITPETITRDFTPALMIYDQAFQVGNLPYATALSIVLALVVGAASAIIYKLTNRSES